MNLDTLASVERDFKHDGALCFVQADPDHWSDSLWCLPLGDEGDRPKGLDGARINGTNGAECKVLLLVRRDDGVVRRINLGRSQLVSRCSRLYEGHLEAGSWKLEY
jgi:hypothetical protein